MGQEEIKMTTEEEKMTPKEINEHEKIVEETLKSTIKEVEGE